MSALRLAHVSDLHVPSHWPRAPWLYLGKRAIGAFNYRFRRSGQHPLASIEALVRELAADTSIDHIAVTGDLTNVAFPIEFEAARAFLQTWIDRAPGFVSMVPGNHDRYTHVSDRGRYFERVFKDCISSELDLGAPYPFVRFREGVAILGLDSGVATPPLFATGTLGREQRARLERALDHPSVKAASFRVALVHHPPLNARGERDRFLHRLTDDREFLEIAARGRIDLVLTGHIHDAFAVTFEKGGHVVRGFGVGSSTRVHKKPEKLGRVNVYTIDAGRLASVETRAFDPGRGAYVRVA